MMNRDSNYNYIEDKLISLSRKIESQNTNNLTSLNIHVEYFFRDLLNCLFDYEFINSNEIEKNAVAIDLGDIKNKICIQVTSDKSLKKVKDTIRLFEDKKLYERYDRLIILQIVKKTKRKKAISATHVSFNVKNDIWDYSDLTSKYKSLTIEKQQKVLELVKKELDVDKPQQVILPDNGQVIKTDEKEIEKISSGLLNAFRPPYIVEIFSNVNENIYNAVDYLTNVERYLIKRSAKQDDKSKLLVGSLYDFKHKHTLITAQGGAGKTHLLWSFAEGLLERNKIPIFISLRDFNSIDDISKYLRQFGNEITLKKLSNISNVVLKIDELFYVSSKNPNKKFLLSYKALLDYSIKSQLSFNNNLQLAKILAVYSNSILENWFSSYIAKKGQHITGVLWAIKYLKGQVIIDESNKLII